MKLFKLMLAVCLSVLLGGCMKADITVNLKKDGSGTVVSREVMSAKALMALQGMAQPGMPNPVDKFTSIDKTKLSKQALQWGEGVTLVSAKAITAKDGGKGREVVYAFKDINKLKINPQGMLDNEQGDADDDDDDDDDTDEVTFKYTPGKLVMSVAEDAEDDAEEMSQMAEIKNMPPQMKGMFQGLRMTVTLKFEGKIKKTNAAYVLPDKTGIIMMDMDVGKLVNDTAAIDKLSKAKPSDRVNYKKVIDSIGYLKLENQPKVEVEF